MRMLEGLALTLGLLVLGSLSLVLYRQRRQRAAQAGQALLRATEAGDVAEMQALLQRGADVQARNARGWTPLHVAAAGGEPTVVALLLQHGADVHAQSYVGMTPLDNAIARGSKKAVTDLLRAHGAIAATQE